MSRGRRAFLKHVVVRGAMVLVLLGGLLGLLTSLRSQE